MAPPTQRCLSVPVCCLSFFAKRSGAAAAMVTLKRAIHSWTRARASRRTAPKGLGPDVLIDPAAEKLSFRMHQTYRP